MRQLWITRRPGARELAASLGSLDRVTDQRRTMLVRPKQLDSKAIATSAPILPRGTRPFRQTSYL